MTVQGYLLRTAARITEGYYGGQEGEDGSTEGQGPMEGEGVVQALRSEDVQPGPAGRDPELRPSTLMGRITEVTVHDLTGDFSKMHIKIRFQVNEVRGFEAHTIFIGQDLTSDYVRRLTRRKRTKTDHVIDVRTKDGYLVRIKPMSITDQRIQASQETAVRNIMTKTLNDLAADMTISDLVKSIITGDMSKELSNAAKVIVPIKRIEVRKTEVLEMGTASAEEPSIQERSARKPRPRQPPSGRRRRSPPRRGGDPGRGRESPRRPSEEQK